MSILHKAARKMRIIAIPLTRPKPNTTLNQKASRVLTYYQFQLSPPPASPAAKAEETTNGTNSGNAGTSILSRWLPEEGAVNWATGKAANIWAGFGKSQGWKLKVYQSGEKLVDRMDFEELALKGIDPSKGPSISPHRNTQLEGEDEKQTRLSIPLIYPQSRSTDSGVLQELRDLLAYRTPRHRKGFYMWMLIAPLTAPFMIVPVIPNIPFFFCAWRSWSHYKAYRASQYLQSLLENDVIVPEASEALDVIYKDFVPPKDVNDAQSPPNCEHQHHLLLTRDAVPAIITQFGLKKIAEADLYRAVEQARTRVHSGRQVL